MPAESPPCGAVVAYRLAPQSLEGGCKPALSVRSFTAPRPPSLPVTANLAWPRYGERVAGELRIEPIAEEQLEALLPLIAAYQRFYEAETIDEERNRAFFSRFIAPSEDGMLLGAWRDGRAGRLRLPLLAASPRLVPAETVLMNDLYVDPAARGEGVGRALIEASAAVARERGAHRLEWATAPDNETAQRLYDSTGAERSEWIEYELPL